MGIFRRLTGLLATKSMPPMTISGGTITPPPPISRDPRRLIEIGSTGVAGSCNGLNARTIASAELKLAAVPPPGRRMMDGIQTRSIPEIARRSVGLPQGSVEIVSHPALDLIRAGTPHLDGRQTMEVTEAYLGSIGNAHWLIRRGASGEPVGIDLLPSEWVSVITNGAGDEIAYQIDSLN